MRPHIREQKEISHTIFNCVLQNHTLPHVDGLLACGEILHEVFAMPCRHIVKYMMLALAFGSCLAYTQTTALANAADISPSMLIPKCLFI